MDPGGGGAITAHRTIDRNGCARPAPRFCHQQQNAPLARAAWRAAPRSPGGVLPGTVASTSGHPTYRPDAAHQKRRELGARHDSQDRHASARCGLSAEAATDAPPGNCTTALLSNVPSSAIVSPGCATGGCTASSAYGAASTPLSGSIIPSPCRGLLWEQRSSTDTTASIPPRIRPPPELQCGSTNCDVLPVIVLSFLGVVEPQRSGDRAMRFTTPCREVTYREVTYACETRSELGARSSSGSARN